MAKNEDKINKLIDTLLANNSNTPEHKEQHKCLWEQMKHQGTEIEKIKDVLFSNIPTQKGLCYRIDENRKDLNRFKMIFYIGVGLLAAVKIIGYLYVVGFFNLWK